MASASSSSPYVRHRCPVCGRMCRTPENLSPAGYRTGRPPNTRRKLLAILQKEASRQRPMPLNMLAKRLGITPDSVVSTVYRVRRFDGKTVINVRERGYYTPKA